MFALGESSGARMPQISGLFADNRPGHTFTGTQFHPECHDRSQGYTVSERPNTLDDEYEA